MSSYHSDKKSIIDTKHNKRVAVASYEAGAEIIVKALNYYFDKKTFRENDAVEMMHNNTADALKRIADFIEKHEYDWEATVEWLREMAEEMEAQAIVVSMRDELNFDKPKEDIE